MSTQMQIGNGVYLVVYSDRKSAGIVVNRSISWCLVIIATTKHDTNEQMYELDRNQKSIEADWGGSDRH
jgi:hypothetical protein